MQISSLILNSIRRIHSVTRSFQYEDVIMLIDDKRQLPLVHGSLDHIDLLNNSFCSIQFSNIYI